MDFQTYETEGFYDELFAPDGSPRLRGEPLVRRLQTIPMEDLQRRQKRPIWRC
jgi:hypothetical protein